MKKYTNKGSKRTTMDNDGAKWARKDNNIYQSILYTDSNTSSEVAYMHKPLFLCMKTVVHIFTQPTKLKNKQHQSCINLYMFLFGYFLQNYFICLYLTSAVFDF